MQPGWRHNLQHARAALCVLLLLLLHSGCTRKFFRVDADQEVGALLAEKDRYAFWKIQNYRVYPDPRARFADPTDPDCPPKPPDDPAAYYLSPDPQRCPRPVSAWVEGTAYLDYLAMWDESNRAMGVQPSLGDSQRMDIARLKAPRGEGASMAQTAYQGEAKETKLTLGTPEPAPVAQTKSSAVQQAQYNQPAKLPEQIDEKQPMETIPECRTFLIDLDQSVELALFNSRDYQTRCEELYLFALPVTLERYSFAFQFFATENAIRRWTGPEHPRGPANQWDTSQVLGFSKLFSTGAQLLFGFANRTVVNLTPPGRHTISESIINLDFIQPLLRGGGRAVTLEPLTQTERNLLYNIRDFARFRKAFYASIATGGDLDVLNVQPVRQGYLPVLLRIAQLEIQQKNTEALSRLFTKYLEFEKGNIVTQLQVAEVKSQLLESQNNVRSGLQAVYDALDRFKIQLGLPVTLLLDLADTPIRPMNQQLRRYDDLFAEYGATVELIKESFAKPDLRSYLSSVYADSPFTRGTKFSREFPKRWQLWWPKNLSAPALDQKLQELNANLIKLKKVLDERKREPSEGENARLLQMTEDIEVGTLEILVRQYETKQLDAERNLELVRAAEVILNAEDLQDAWKKKLLKLRDTWPELPEVSVAGVDLLGDKQMAEETVVQTALTLRLDLMNLRAQAVDAWRQIRVRANALLGIIDVEYHLESITPLGEAKPFAFSGHRSSHELEFNAEAPLVRKLERNIYREALFDYQRARRFVMAGEDNVAAQVRRLLRQLRVFAANYKVLQEQVELAYLRVDNSLETLGQPPRPGQVAASGDAPALTRQVLDAQNNLLRVQRELYTLWINFLITRVQLYRDIELLPVDARGVWIDEFATSEQPQASGSPDGEPAEERLAAPGLLPPTDRPPARITAP